MVAWRDFPLQPSDAQSDHAAVPKGDRPMSHLAGVV
jgi:hypothetical protein